MPKVTDPDLPLDTAMPDIPAGGGNGSGQGGNGGNGKQTLDIRALKEMTIAAAHAGAPRTSASRARRACASRS